MTDERIAAIEEAHVPIELDGVKGCRHPTNGGWYWWAECDVAYLLARLRAVEQDHAAANDVPFLKARLREVEKRLHRSEVDSKAWEKDRDRMRALLAERAAWEPQGLGGCHRPCRRPRGHQAMSQDAAVAVTLVIVVLLLVLRSLAREWRRYHR